MGVVDITLLAVLFLFGGGEGKISKQVYIIYKLYIIIYKVKTLFQGQLLKHLLLLLLNPDLQVLALTAKTIYLGGSTKSQFPWKNMSYQLL